MHRASPSQLLKILVVTEDRSTQRQLSQFFDMMGYQALQAAEPHSALAAIDAESPHIVLLGSEIASRGDWELCGSLSRRQQASAMFKFLLVDEVDPAQLHDALEAGIDDVLVKPIDYGELMARLRTAARVLEFDRRVSQQNRFDPQTGLLDRFAFAAKVRGRREGHAGTSPRGACVVLDVDFFSRINRLHGTSSGDFLLHKVAAELNHLCTNSEVLGCLGADRFAVLLPAANESAACEWAEHARDLLAATTFEIGATSVQITASFGITCCGADDSAEQIIERATKALETAKSSGRNCVVRSGEYNANGHELTAPGKLFERTVARDVMTPCTVYLQPDEPAGQAIDLLERTRLDAIAVVDAGGKLVGVCERDNMITVAESEYSKRTVRELMSTDVQTFGEQEKFSSLLDFFTRDQRSSVFVVERDRPIGFVTCNGLLAMSKPLSTDSLAAASEYSDSSDYLLVPDLRPLECEQTA